MIEYGHELVATLSANAYAQQILDVVKRHHAWAPMIVFLLAFGESLAVVGLFVPATFALVGIGALVGATDIEFWPIWLAAAIGAGLGD